MCVYKLISIIIINLGTLINFAICRSIMVIKEGDQQIPFSKSGKVEKFGPKVEKNSRTYN